MRGVGLQPADPPATCVPPNLHANQSAVLFVTLVHALCGGLFATLYTTPCLLICLSSLLQAVLASLFPCRTGWCCKRAERAMHRVSKPLTV